MSKRSNKSRVEKKVQQEKPLVPVKYETPIFIALLLILLIVFLHEAVFENKIFISADLSTSQSLKTFTDQANQQNVFPLWIPYLFSGMPSFASLLVGGDRWYDIVGTIFGWIDHAGGMLMLNQDVGWVMMYYFLFGIGMFILLRRHDLSKFASFFGSVAAMFSTFIIIWIMVGHNTKIAAVAFLPIVLTLVIELMRRFRWSYLAALVIALHLQFQSTHLQMIFYSYLAVGLYLIFMLVRSLLKMENIAGTFRSAGLLIVASAVAFIMSADVYFSTYEYSKYSIRGSSPIVQTKQDKSTEGGGLDYEYATNWSFSPEEMLTFFIPSYFGFGDIVYNGPLSGNQTIHPNTYFGPMTFTDAPFYMGVIVILLAIVGFMINRKNPFVISSFIIIIVALLISFGREFPLLYDLMFNYFPYFNKFRSPSSTLILVQVFVPILAAFGVDAVVKARLNSGPENSKKWLIWTGVFGGMLVLILLLQGSIRDSYYAMVRDSAKFHSAQDQICDLLFTNMINDLYISLLICILTTGAIYLYLRRKISTVVCAGALTLILLFDLWRVDYQPMQLRDRQIQVEEFAEPDFVKFIKAQTPENVSGDAGMNNQLFRVLEIEGGQPATSADLAYFLLQEANGYSGAKIRIYQDMIDVTGLSNPNVTRLLGVKYIVTDKPDPILGQVVFKGSRIVEENKSTLPRAFFVDNYRVADGLQILNMLGTGAFDPARSVYFENDPKLSVQAPDSSVYAKFLDYKIQSMKLQVKASGNNLLLLSEVYYPAGWKAYIDGKPTEIYKADYFLRALLVPKGIHEIDLNFEPKVYSIGKAFTLGSNGLVILLLIAGLPRAILNRRKNAAVPSGNVTNKEG